MPDRAAQDKSRSLGGPRKTGLALRFISGKYQGGEFPLEKGQTIVIGRSSDLDMVLVEEMVSRRHARIEVRDQAITIDDLGSTNGTFVNGEKIRSSELHEGDRVLIGTSILKLVAVGKVSDAPLDLEAAARKMEHRTRPSPAPAEIPRMTGSLEEIPLPDLLQLFGTSRKTGVLLLRTDDHTGRIWLTNGMIVFAAIEDQAPLKPLKVIYRMLEWRRGVFELDPPEEVPSKELISVSAQEVLMEGFRQHDELSTLRAKLPRMTSRLALKSPLEAPLHELEPTHLEVLQLALNSRNVEHLFDRAPGTDLETAKIILALMQRGYLQTEG